MTSIELKILTKHTSCEYKCKFDGRKCNSYHNWNNDKWRCESNNPKEHNACEKDYICNPSTCIRYKSRYSASFIDESVITCNEIINRQ